MHVSYRPGSYHKKTFRVKDFCCTQIIFRINDIFLKKVMHLNVSGFSGSKVTKLKPDEYCDVMNHRQQKSPFYDAISLGFSRLL